LSEQPVAVAETRAHRAVEEKHVLAITTHFRTSLRAFKDGRGIDSRGAQGRERDRGGGDDEQQRRGRGGRQWIERPHTEQETPEQETSHHA